MSLQLLSVISFLLLFAVAPVFSSHQVQEDESDWNLRHLQDTTTYGLIRSTDYTSFANSTTIATNACFKVEDSDGVDASVEGNAIVLGDCDESNAGFRLDSNRLIQFEGEPGLCVQTGRGRTPDDGNVPRLFPCDTSRSSQKFIYGPSLGIRPLLNPSLCVVWQGAVPDIDEDPILLNPCINVGDRLHWNLEVA